MKTEIYLIRHSEPLKCNDTPNEKIHLSDEGIIKAKELSNLEELSNLDLVISSSYSRAIETAEYLVKDNKLIIDESYNERKLGTEKKDKSFWLTQMYDENAKTIDGESQKEVRDRMLKALNKVLMNNSIKRCAIVTHAAAMTFLLMNWCKLEYASLEGKKRKLSFNNKVIIDDSFKTPEIFKLIFNNNDLISIERINI